MVCLLASVSWMICTRHLNDWEPAFRMLGFLRKGIAAVSETRLYCAVGKSMGPRARWPFAGCPLLGKVFTASLPQFSHLWTVANQSFLRYTSLMRLKHKLQTEAKMKRQGFSRVGSGWALQVPYLCSVTAGVPGVAFVLSHTVWLLRFADISPEYKSPAIPNRCRAKV